jgi:hypothetical protein
MDDAIAKSTAALAARDGDRGNPALLKDSNDASAAVYGVRKAADAAGYVFTSSQPPPAPSTRPVQF